MQLGLNGLGDITKVLPEVMNMSRATQRELSEIRILLKELVDLQSRALLLASMESHQ
jgi:hypothetical protein